VGGGGGEGGGGGGGGVGGGGGGGLFSKGARVALESGCSVALGGKRKARPCSRGRLLNARSRPEIEEGGCL